MRQSEGSAVIDNCGKILAGRYDFIENDAFKIRNCKSEDEAKAYLKSCYTGDPHRTQILSTTKKGTVGTMSLNHDLKILNSPESGFITAISNSAIRLFLPKTIMMPVIAMVISDLLKR